MPNVANLLLCNNNHIFDFKVAIETTVHYFDIKPGYLEPWSLNNLYIYSSKLMFLFV